MLIAPYTALQGPLRISTSSPRLRVLPDVPIKHGLPNSGTFKQARPGCSNNILSMFGVSYFCSVSFSFTFSRKLLQLNSFSYLYNNAPIFFLVHFHNFQIYICFCGMFDEYYSQFQIISNGPIISSMHNIGLDIECQSQDTCEINGFLERGS